MDLGAFGEAGDLGGSPEPANAAPEPKPTPAPEAPKPKEVPKPKSVEKPKIKPVVVKDQKADMHLPKEEKPKEPEKKIEPKPVEKPKVEDVKPASAMEKPIDKPVHTATGSEGSGAGNTVGDSKSQGQGGGGEGKGKGNKKGDSTGGGGAGGDGSSAGGSASNPVKRGGQIPQPPYPPLSIENNEEGVVVLKVLVAPGGKVNNVTIVKSSGHRRLDREAEKAARRGQFDAPVWTEFNIPVRFRLN